MSTFELGLLWSYGVGAVLIYAFLVATCVIDRMPGWPRLLFWGLVVALLWPLIIVIRAIR
jgi:hypothetical protein